jgi:hypothetical protein
VKHSAGTTNANAPAGPDPGERAEQHRDPQVRDARQRDSEPLTERERRLPVRRPDELVADEGRIADGQVEVLVRRRRPLDRAAGSH